MRGVTRAARKALGDELVPQWPPNMPRPAPARLPPTARDGAAAVYLPACVNRIFGRARNGDGERPSLPEAMVAVSERAGLALWIPDDVDGYCCATPWSSKAMPRARAGWRTIRSARFGAGATVASCRSSAMRRRARSASPPTRCRC